MPVDLNHLRTVVLQNQRNNQALPADPNMQVVVDRDGNVIMGNQVRPGERTTQIPQETFARMALE